MQSAPFLGPMMAVSLAISLSYIHLDKFRHRVIVRDYARNCHDELEPDMGGREDSPSWRRICKLAEYAAPAKDPKRKRNSLTSTSEKIYSVVFKYAIDAKIATGAAFLCPAFLIYWTGHLMGYFGPILNCPGMECLLFATYTLLVVVIVCMILAASVGPVIVIRVKRRIDDYKHEIDTLIKRTADEFQQKALATRL